MASAVVVAPESVADLADMSLSEIVAWVVSGTVVLVAAGIGRQEVAGIGEQVALVAVLSGSVLQLVVGCHSCSIVLLGGDSEGIQWTLSEIVLGLWFC